MKPFLSLCMIVKNEEKVIDRCLGSIAHLVDEVVVVDTGSTDRTKLIVAGYTSNIYDFEWINDFSAARNFAASKATGDWIIVLDADEYVDEENFKEFIIELKANGNNLDALGVKILNFTGSFGEGLIQNYHDRIYKNNGEISYYRAIHEQFKKHNGEKLIIKNSNLLVFHSGYLNKTVAERNKSERNQKLLDNEMKKGENNAFDYFNFGNEYFSIGDYSKALDSFLMAYKLKRDFRLSWVSVALVQIISCLIHLKRYDDALDVIGDAENIYSTSPEFPYLKAEVFFSRGQIEDAIEIYHYIINNSGRYNHIILRPDLKDQSPHLRLGEIYLYHSDYTSAINHYSNVLNINKYNDKAISKVVFILNKFHNNKEIQNFLLENNLVNQKNINTYVRASLNVGNPDLALSLLESHEEYTEISSKIVLLKKICIQNKGDNESVSEIFEDTVMKELIEANWINVVDLVILQNILSGSKYSDVLSLVKEEREFVTLSSMLENEELQGEINENLFLFSLETLINYNQIDKAESLFNYLDQLNEDGLSKVAALLYAKGFTEEAIQLYEKVDWNYFSEQDFLNITEYMLQFNNIKDTIEICQTALTKYEMDFRFYKIIIEHTRDESLFTDVITKARALFKHSNYLTQFK
ncbi:tetratricopeptide repeat-containing glycosyltransferase family 2 protein [Metabacillus halosaccharovorans]|uniref:tetratricopeptide repeat-containing glycosyltransferase family 2 protein n=1 Tax=Metabacillus halosaccharovorans TaxID=930124 RepID=UPI001C1F8A42|nr:TPR domain-containing glycosyltransferase [Metabacillus halosaccharovorans]MBU7594569.1 glycosyltransferase [Metabacillus halosaccharovorans]